MGRRVEENGKDHRAGVHEGEDRRAAAPPAAGATPAAAHLISVGLIRQSTDGGVAHTDPVWTYVQTWIVQDDVVPELRVGDRLAGVGVRAKCSQIREEPAGVHRWRTGRVARVGEIEAMDRWGDEDHRYSSAYLLDLLPST
jgi:hypothetical protein